MNTQTDVTVENGCTVTCGGVDTIHCSFYCKFSPRFMKHLDEISFARHIAEQPAESDDESQPVFACGQRLYVVMPYGFNPNKGISRYCYYKYVLKDGGITIGIQPRDYVGKRFGEEGDKDKKSCPNVRVEVGSLPLILAGSMETIMQEVEERLQEMGLEIIKNRLGRVDPCADLPIHVDRLQFAVYQRRFISRTRNFDLHVNFDDDGWESDKILPSDFDDDHKASLHYKGYNCTGFSIGRDKIMCRGYDKLVKEKHNEEMWLALEQRRCGGKMWENMTRIEFQIRREALRGMTVEGKQNGIETWQDFVAHQSAIVHYLCTEWLVFTAKGFARTHSERVKQQENLWHPDWIMAVSAFKRTFGEPNQKISRISKSLKREAKAHIAQALGCGQSALIKTAVELTPYDPLWKEKIAAFQYASTIQYLSDPAKEKSFWKSWHEKEMNQECSIPIEALSDLVPLANKGAGVTHSSPVLETMGVLLMTPGASGPAPVFIS